jgi:hypothetical protein
LGSQARVTSARVAWEQFGSGGFGFVNYIDVSAIGSISNGLALIDIPINWRDAFIGIILIVAISVDSLQHQMKTAGIFKSSKRNKILLEEKAV